MSSQAGCRRSLKAGQWWGFCGETDMGQTLPALCTECGGPYILELPSTKKLRSEPPTESDFRRPPTADKG